MRAVLELATEISEMEALSSVAVLSLVAVEDDFKLLAGDILRIVN